jgi:murein DD-endopeptidase MepM/ murein hydrolase activator NlpD
MRRLSRRVVLVLGLTTIAVLGAVVGVAGSASEQADPSQSTARAAAIQIVVPGGSGGGTPPVAAPPVAAPVVTPAFAYASGSGNVVTAATTSASATAALGATATSGVTGLVLFGGEITADSVLARAGAITTATTADGDFTGTGALNVQALGAPVTAAQTPLADWGTLTINAPSVERGSSAGRAQYRGSVIALHVQLTADHGGLPAGSEIQIGYAEVAVQSLPPAPETQTETQTTATTTSTTTTTAPAPKPSTTATPRPKPKPKPSPKPQPEPQPEPTTEPEPATPKEQAPPPEPDEPGPPPAPPPGLFPFPPELTPELEGGPYVFPVFGEAGYGGAYGAIRYDVSYHHGDDIFGELGQPLVAVADGTVFSVGWNKLGGNRLWLRDRQGNNFYYAHLSAFSTLIFNGARVKAGQVVGFMGTTGDADGTPVHLHFEVHPVSLLYLGYDGAIDPTPFLAEAKRLERLPFPVPPGWAPAAGGSNAAPPPGAILLSVADISSADGADPESLRRAIEAPRPRP